MPKIISTKFKGNVAAADPPYPQLLLDLKAQLIQKDAELTESRAFGQQMKNLAKQESERQAAMRKEFNGVEEFLRAKNRDQVAKHNEDIELLQRERAKVLSLRKTVADKDSEVAKNRDTVKQAVAEVHQLQASVQVSTSTKSRHLSLESDLDKARSEIVELRESVTAWTQLASSQPTIIVKSGCNCMICLELISPVGVGMRDLGCGHLMCADCVPTWKAQKRAGKRTCPICQAKTPYEPAPIYLQ